jgi:hypothetical protein
VDGVSRAAVLVGEGYEGMVLVERLEGGRGLALVERIRWSG